MPHDIICRSISLNGFYELELLQGMCSLVREKRGVVLDIGANIGNHSLYFSRQYSKVIAFEPVPSNCQILKANLYLNKIQNVTLIEKGLSNKKTKMAVDISNRHNTNNGLSDIQTATDTLSIVDVATGDEEIDNLRLCEQIVLMKIDVEGHENLVVEGLKKTIHKHTPIIFWEAFSRKEADKTRLILEKIGYKHFYHLTSNRYRNGLLNKLHRGISRAAYIVDYDSCEVFDGMNVAAVTKL